MNKSALSIASLISCLAEDDKDVQAFYTTRDNRAKSQAEFQPATVSKEPGTEIEEDIQMDNDQWGLKTAEMPDPQIYPSSEI